MEFLGILKKLQEHFPGLIKRKIEFPAVTKKVESPGFLVLGLNISKVCDNKVLWSF